MICDLLLEAGSTLDEALQISGWVHSDAQVVQQLLT